MNVKQIGDIVNRNSSHILTGTAILGLAATTYFAVKGTVRSIRATDELIQEMEHDYQDGGIEPLFLRKRDYVRLNWKFYIPAAACGAATIASIVGAHTIDTRRQLAYAAAATLVKNNFEEFRAKTIEKIGAKGEEEIRGEIAKEKLEALDADNQLMVIGDGKVLCYDRYSGRAFENDMESIRRAENDINAGIINHMYASLNDFYRRIGLEETDMGEQVGFNTDNMLSVAYSSTLVNGKPAIAIDFVNLPETKYHKIW